jgi:hypothetical protein
VPAQVVDATPSGIKLFSKVVFMKQGRRFGLSAVQKNDCWLDCALQSGRRDNSLEFISIFASRQEVEFR